MVWTRRLGRSIQDFDLEGEPRNKSLLFRTSSSSARNGTAPVYVNFADFSKALKKERKERLWDIMGHYGIPDIFLRTFKTLYHQSASFATEGGKYSSYQIVHFCDKLNGFANFENTAGHGSSENFRILDYMIVLSFVSWVMPAFIHYQGFRRCMDVLRYDVTFRHLKTLYRAVINLRFI